VHSFIITVRYPYWNEGVVSSPRAWHGRNAGQEEVFSVPDTVSVAWGSESGGGHGVSEVPSPLDVFSVVVSGADLLGRTGPRGFGIPDASSVSRSSLAAYLTAGVAEGAVVSLFTVDDFFDRLSVDAESLFLTSCP
jgi:hypothetical protein